MNDAAEKAGGAAASAAPPSSRVAAFDIARVLAIASVLALHVTAFTHTNAPQLAWAWVLNRSLIGYAAPVLLAVAGALSWTPSRLREGDFVPYLLARSKRVLVPYGIWAVGYLMFLAATGQPPASSLGGYALLFVTGLAYYHLWFVPAVMLVYVLAPAGARAAAKHPAFVLLVGYGVAIAVVAMLRLPHPWLNWRVERALFTTFRYLPYAAWGALFATWPALRAGLRRWWPLAAAVAVAIALMLAPTEGDLALWGKTTGAGLMILAVLGACSVLGERWRAADRAAEGLSPLTYVIYLSHAMLLAAMVSAIAAQGRLALFGETWFVVALYAATAVSSGAVAWAWGRAARWSRRRDAATAGDAAV